MDLQQKPSRSRAFIIGGVILLVALALFYWGFLRTPEPEVYPTTSEENVIPDIDLSTLERSILDRFRSWSVLPVIVGETGRENPFSQE